MREELILTSYIIQHLPERYSLEQIPKLYAFLFNTFSALIFGLSCTKETPCNKKRHYSREIPEIAQSCLQKAYKLILMYEHQLKHDELSALSKFYDSQVCPERYSQLHGQILFHLCIMHSNTSSYKQIVIHLEKAKEHFIRNQAEYTIYCIAMAPTDFFLDYIQKMVLDIDFNGESSDYHMNCKHLLIKAAKIWKHHPLKPDGEIFGRCSIYLGVLHYMWFPQKIKRAIKYLVRGFKKVIKEIKSESSFAALCTRIFGLCLSRN